MDVLAFSWPVQLASLMLDPGIWGRKPFGYQLTSVLPHAANMVMVWGVVRSLGAAARQTAVDGRLFERVLLDQQVGRIRVNEDDARIAGEELKRLGFSAIYINRNGFPDRAKGLEDVLLELGYSKPPIRNATGDLVCIVLEKDGG